MASVPHAGHEKTMPNQVEGQVEVKSDTRRCFRKTQSSSCCLLILRHPSASAQRTLTRASKTSSSVTFLTKPSLNFARTPLLHPRPRPDLCSYFCRAVDILYLVHLRISPSVHCFTFACIPGHRVGFQLMLEELIIVII